MAFNSVSAAAHPLDFRSSSSFGALVLHELGHVVGLEHVAPFMQIMGPWGARWSTHGHLGKGDLQGLATLQGRPCRVASDATPDATVPQVTEPETAQPPVTTTPPSATPSTTEPPTTTSLPTAS